MTRLNALPTDTATGKTKELFNAIEGKLGMVPNMMKTMGNSPAFLEGYLNLSSALSSGSLGAQTGELIALAVAEANACSYCLSAHTYIGGNMLKIKDDAMLAARSGRSDVPKIDAILKFALSLVIKRGHVDDVDVATVKAAGVTDGQIGEIIGQVALNILTNYFNNTADTVVDFPVVETFAKSAA